MSEQEKLRQIALENGVFETRLTRKYLKRKPYERQDPRIIKASIPGIITEITASAGARVKQGDTLLTLEAMKMLNRIPASVDGTVKTVRVSRGDRVSKGQVLIELG